MKGFEVPFREQVRNVLEGRTADGSSTHALWPLPQVLRMDALHGRTLELSYWTICRASDQQRHREELRTFAIWSTAAHLWRLTRRGDTLDTASREITWTGAVMLEKPEFVATCAFARKLMPGLLPDSLRANRPELRDDVLEILDICRRRWKPRDDEPMTEGYEPPWSVKRYRMPAHFLSTRALAPKWTSIIACIQKGDAVDHDYWTDVAHDKRLVFALFVDGACKATFESHKGYLDSLVVLDPSNEDTYHRLSSALPRLEMHLGDIFRIPARSLNPAVLSLAATNEQRLREINKSLALMRRNSQMENRPPAPTPGRKALPGTTDRWLAKIAAAAFVLYMIPFAILAAPYIGKSYILAWERVLGMEPGCLSFPSLGAEGCRLRQPAKRQDMLTPIPPSEDAR